MSNFISLTLLILTLYNCHQECTANPFLTAKKAFDFVSGVYNFIDHQAHTYDDTGFLESMSAGESATYNKLTELSIDFNYFKETLFDNLSYKIKDVLADDTNKLFDLIKTVQNKYVEFLDFFINVKNHPRSELEEFADSSISTSIGQLKSVAQKIHETFRDPDIRKRSILSIIASDVTAGDTICIRGQSSQQFIHDLYELVVLTDAKGLIVRLYGYALKEKFDNESYKHPIEKEIELYYKRVNETFHYVKQAMNKSSREIWRCDPVHHLKDKTYAKLEVFQSYFMKEQDSSLGFWNAATRTCASQKNVRLNCKSEPCKAQPEDRRCTGNIRNCDKEASFMQVCHSPPGSDRRYDWMKTFHDSWGLKKLDKLYGRAGPCKNTQGLWTPTPFLFLYFDACLCNCESDHRAADRYFSLEPVVSDVENNKVVTGVRFNKTNNVIYIQIQQGTLGPNGTIKETPHDKPEWKDINVISTHDLVENFSIFHHDLISGRWENDDRVDKYNDTTEFLKNDKVYAVTYDQSIVYLDSMEPRLEELVTGFQFTQEGNDLKLEIQTTPFDYATGKLNLDGTVLNDNNLKSRNSRSEVVLDQPDDPSRRAANVKNKSKTAELDTISDKDQYVRFQLTDKFLDLGQSTVPFIDLQNVETKPSMPISGAGLIHRGRKLSGGFLAFKLIHYDYTLHM